MNRLRAVFLLPEANMTDLAWEGHVARMQRHVYGPQARRKNIRAFFKKYRVLMGCCAIGLPIFINFAYWKISSLL